MFPTTSVDLTLVDSQEDVRVSLARFNEEAPKYPELTGSLLQSTTYWVFDPESGRFGPSKFVGWKGITMRNFALATAGSASKRTLRRRCDAGRGFLRAGPGLRGSSRPPTQVPRLGCGYRIARIAGRSRSVEMAIHGSSWGDRCNSHVLDVCVGPPHARPGVYAC